MVERRRAYLDARELIPLVSLTPFAYLRFEGTRGSVFADNRNVASDVSRIFLNSTSEAVSVLSAIAREDSSACDWR